MPTLNPEQREKRRVIMELRHKGWAFDAIGKVVGYSGDVIRQVVREERAVEAKEKRRKAKYD